jgi:uncharacterized oligopeptide transporter (OPT) family protein
MEDINIITPGFSLEDVTTDIINTDTTDYSMIIYISIVIFIGIVGMIISNLYNLYNKKKRVSFQEVYNEYYNNV